MQRKFVEDFLCVFPQALVASSGVDPGGGQFPVPYRPWFSRLWVFQEAILSSTNMFGIVYV